MSRGSVEALNSIWTFCFLLQHRSQACVINSDIFAPYTSHDQVRSWIVYEEEGMT
jgi:hypothetical protein